MTPEGMTIDVSKDQVSRFMAALRSWHRGPTITDIEGVDELAPAPIDTSWMREENWDLGRLAPAA